MGDPRTTIREALADAERTVERLKAALAELGDDVPPVDTDLDFDPTNLISTGEAAQIAGRSKETIRRWCRDDGIGKPKPTVGGRMVVSLPRLRRHMGLA